MVNIRTTFRKKYGRDWPVEAHDIQIELLCAKKWFLPEYRAGQLDRPGEHLLRAIRALFTRDQWSISPWTVEHAHAWCEEDTLGICGCASSSKSNDVGGFTVLDWITDPTDTISILASTGKLALADRSYESVLRYHQLLKANPHFFVPGIQSKGTMAIINDSDDAYGEVSTTKAAIRGVAVQEGTADQARANLQGRHMGWVRLILDEFSQMREAAADARINLRIGARHGFKWIFLFNPDSFTDLGARYAEPAEGWQTVDADTPRWRTKSGALILHRNGYQSPAVVEPDGAAKYPYLINAEQIAKTIADEHGNEDAKSVWTMVKGFPRPNASEQTVLSEADLNSFQARVMPVWDDRGVEEVMVAGLDPANSSGGDACVLSPGIVGLSREGSAVCAFLDQVYIPIRESAPRPAVYQVSDQVVEICAKLGIPMDHIAVDCSGTQSAGDVIAVETGVHPIICDFGGSASDLPISAVNLKPAKERCRNHATELWMLIAEFVRCGQIRNLGPIAAQQFTTRRFKSTPGPLKQLESKKEYKKRTSKHSPDEADAAALCVWAARQVAGLRAGFNTLQGSGATPRMGNNEVVVRSVNKLRSSYKQLDFGRLYGYTLTGNR